MRGRCSSWVLGVVTDNKLSRLFSDRFQCGPKKSVPVSTHLQNSGYWGRRQVAKNGLIEVFRCLVEICPPLVKIPVSSVGGARRATLAPHLVEATRDTLVNSHGAHKIPSCTAAEHYRKAGLTMVLYLFAVPLPGCKEGRFCSRVVTKGAFAIVEDAGRGHALQIRLDLLEESLHSSKTDFCPAPPDVYRLLHLNIIFYDQTKHQNIWFQILYCGG